MFNFSPWYRSFRNSSIVTTLVARKSDWKFFFRTGNETNQKLCPPPSTNTCSPKIDHIAVEIQSLLFGKVQITCCPCFKSQFIVAVQISVTHPGCWVTVVKSSLAVAVGFQQRHSQCHKRAPGHSQQCHKEIPVPESQSEYRRRKRTLCVHSSPFSLPQVIKLKYVSVFSLCLRRPWSTRKRSLWNTPKVSATPSKHTSKTESEYDHNSATSFFFAPLHRFEVAPD